MKLKVADICIVHAVTIDGNGLWALIEEVSDLECVQKKEVIEDEDKEERVKEGLDGRTKF